MDKLLAYTPEDRKALTDYGNCLFPVMKQIPPALPLTSFRIEVFGVLQPTSHWWFTFPLRDQEQLDKTIQDIERQKEVSNYAGLENHMAHELNYLMGTKQRICYMQPQPPNEALPSIILVAFYEPVTVVETAQPLNFSFAKDQVRAAGGSYMAITRTLAQVHAARFLSYVYMKAVEYQRIESKPTPLQMRMSNHA